MSDNSYGTPIPFGQTTAQAQAVIDTAIIVWEQMGLTTVQIMYGIAMMNWESGDIPTKTNGVLTDTIRGLGQVRDTTWNGWARTIDASYELSPGSVLYIPQDLTGPSNANFDPSRPAGTNAQAGESNDPDAGQYDPKGLVQQLEVVGQGIKDEWQEASNILNGGNGRAYEAMNRLISQGALGSSYFHAGTPEASALLSTVALAYLGHHEGASWWRPGNNFKKTKDDLNGKLGNVLGEVVAAFQQEFRYLRNQPTSSSALAGLTDTSVTSADLDSVSASALLLGDPWQLAGADPGAVITNNIPSIASGPGDFLSQTAGGLGSYTVTSTGRITSYTYTAKGTGAADVVSGSATFNFNTGNGSGTQTLASGYVVNYTDSISANGTSAEEQTVDPSGAVVATETSTSHVINGYEEKSSVFYKGSTLQSALLVDFDLLNQTQVQGIYNSNSQLVEIDISFAFGSGSRLIPTDPNFLQTAQEYFLPTVDPYTSPDGSNAFTILSAQGVSALNSLNGLSSASANVDPGFQANVVLSDGSTLSWHFNPDGTVSSRNVVGSDGNSQNELFNTSGRYVGTSITASSGDGSTITTTYNTSGVETGYSTTATYDPGSSLTIDGSTTTYANGYTLTTQYSAPGAGGMSATLSFSVSSTVENADGTATTTEVNYSPQTNPDGSVTDALTGSTVTITSADESTSTDYDASGNIVGSRVLTTNTNASVTVDKFDSSGTATGSETLSMDSAGNTILSSYGASGQLIDNKALAVSGTLTDTTYSGGSVSGQSVSRPSAEGGNLTTYLSASGSVTGDSWVSPDGSYGSVTVQGGGASTGTTYYTDSTWSNSVNDGKGDVTTTDYNPSGVVTGGVKSVIGSAGITADYTSSDGSVQSGAIFESDGSTQASVAQPSGSSTGINLDASDGFSRVETDSQGVTSGVLLDSNGDVTGTTVTSLAQGGVMTVSDDPNGVETGYSLRSSSGGIVTTTFYSDNAGQFVETGYNQGVTNSDGSTTTTEYSIVGGAPTETGYSTSFTDASGVTTTTSYIQNPDGDGTFVENGNTVVSVNLQGTVTKDEFDANGNLLEYVTERIDGTGDIQVAEYDATGALIQESTAYSSGVVTNILANTASGTVTTTWQPDGAYQQTTDDGEGDVTTTSYSASGVALSDTWSSGDGSHGQDAYSADRSSIGIAYNADGSYSSYSADSNGNTLTQYYSASGTLQSVENSLNDGQGDSVTLGFDAAGDLAGQTWVTANGDTATESFSTQGTDFESNLTTLSGAGGSITGSAQGGIVVGWSAQETLTAGAGPTLLDGVSPDDLIVGGAGNDTLEAFAAGTTLTGGSGSDLFEVNDPTDVVSGGTGADSILSSVSYALPSGVDTLTLSGTSNLSAAGNGDATNTITGNAGDDTLTAGSGSDVLVSGSGVDTLVGGSGPDTFVINNSADVVQPGANSASQDSVESSVSYVLTAPVAALSLTGSDDLSATDGYGHATITGNAGNDTLIGGSGADTLISGTGVDTLEAGTGSNLLVIDDAADVIQVGSTHGSDTVESSVSYSLGAGLDTLELTGSGDLQGRGNADASNLIEGNSGSDTLVAGSGNDTLVAGAGTDLLEGGLGNTTYLFDPGFGQAEIQPGLGPEAIEFGSGITASDITVGLTADSRGNPALLIQDGSGSITVDGGLTGSINAFDFADGTKLTLSGLLSAVTVTPGSMAGVNGNAIINTSPAASLSGGSGQDTILGTGASDTLTAGLADQYLLGTGNNDSIIGGYGNDTLIGGGASDTVLAGNGNQSLYGLGTGDVLTGGMGSDTLYGAGNDTLTAGAGNTVIYGGHGSDTLTLTSGGTVTYYASGTGGVELIELPVGTTFSHFTSYQGAGGDLILQALSGGTTAVIKGFYDGGSSSKVWLIADSTGSVQTLSGWLDSQSPTPPSTYQAEIDQLRQGFAANLTGLLNQIGQQGGTIPEPSRTETDSPYYQYQFDGVSTQNVTVQGGAATLGNSAEDQRTSTTLSTGSTTYTETVPVYGNVTIPGSTNFIPDSSMDPATLQDMKDQVGGGLYENGASVVPATDASGNAGYRVTVPPSIEYEQTGTKTISETVQEYSTNTQETQSFTTYNVMGDGGNDVITVGPEIFDTYRRDIGPYFVGTVNTGNGNVSVNLGMNNGYDPSHGLPTYYYPNQLSPGAFVEAGSGVDTIAGTGGADVIAAGTGFDKIAAAFGSTVYVPLQGASTEDIYISGPYYGSGPLPIGTLVLPDGITPQDLHYRLINNVPNPSNPGGAAGEALQITYGDSTVLMEFGFNNLPPYSPYFQNGPSSDTDGIDRVQFSDGTVLTRDQILAMAGAAVSESAFVPTIAALNPTVTVGATIAGTNLFEASDSSGSNITWFRITNSGGGGAHFFLNGVVQATGQTFYVTKGELAGLTYDAGASGSSDTVKVSAFDGVVWGATTSFNIAPTGSVYQATGPNQNVSGPSGGPDTLVGGYGGDTLIGGSGQDTFEYNSGGGAEAISETVSSSASANVLQFGAGITPASLTLGATGNSQLVLSLGSSGDSVSISGFDPLNPLQGFPIQTFGFADGTKLSVLQLFGDGAVVGSNGSITNVDGSKTSYDFTPSGQQIYYAQKLNASGQLIASVSLNPNGSEVTNSYTYAADGSHSDTVVSTPIGGGGSTTTTYGYDAAGHLVSEQVKNPDGSTGSYTYNAHGQELSGNVTNADGSTNDSTLTYNADGTYSDTIVSTPAGGGASTTTTYGYDAAGHLVSEQVKNPDGSTGSYTYNAQGQELTGNVTNADGSTSDSTLTYNADGTHSDTIVSTPAGGGGSTTTTYGYDAAGHLVSEQVKNPDGSTGSYTYNAQGQELTGNVTNADGSTSDSTLTYNADGTHFDTIVSTPAGGGGSTTTAYGYDSSGHLVSEQVKNPDGSTGSYTYNAQGQELTGNVTNADGSTSDSTLTYNADGTHFDTIVSTPTGGGGSTTTTYGYDAAGHLVSEQVKNPDGSTGSYTYNAQGQELSGDVTNANGSTADSTFAYNSDGSYSDTVVTTAAGGGAATTTVYDYNAQGGLVNDNTYVPGSGGSYTDSWSRADGSHGAYWWNASTSEYQESWHNSDESYWTDDYKYAAGGSPGATGYSFLETYDGSDGSQGTRQYDASPGTVTLSWNSAATGQLNGTTADSGFLGLQNQGELTNNQQDLTFFNPSVSPSFSAFLAAH